MDIEYIFFFLLGFAFVGFAIYCFFHFDKMHIKINPALPEEGQKKFMVAASLLFGLMVIASTVLMLVFQSSEYLDAVMIPTVMIFTVFMLFLWWKFVFSKVERLRIVTLIVFSVVSLACIAFAVYYVYAFGFEPSAEVKVVEEADGGVSLDLAMAAFVCALASLVRFVRLLFCPEKTKVFKSLTEAQRAKADLPSLHKTYAIWEFLQLVVLVTFGIVALRVKMNFWCFLIPIAILSLAGLLVRRRVTVYEGDK